MATALAQSLAQEVPESIIEEAFNRLVAGDLSEISAQLCTARQAFKRFPELVTAEELPAHLIPFITEGESEGIKPEEFIAAEQLEEMRSEAPELAAEWIRRGVRRLQAAGA
jgi:hypothetical protein